MDVFRFKSRLAIFGLFLSALSLPGSESIASINAVNKYQVIAKGLLLLLPLIIMPISKKLTTEQIQKNLLLLLIGVYGIITALWSPMPSYTFIRSVSFIITILGITVIFYAYLKEIRNPYSALLFDLFLATGILLWFFTIIGILDFEFAWRKVYLSNGILKRLGGDILPPNTLGALAAIHMVLILKNGFSARYLNGISIMSVFYVLLNSNSRGAIVALLVAGIIVFVVSSFTISDLKMVSLIFIGLAILAGVLLFLDPQGLEKGIVNISRYKSLEEYTTLTGRTVIWKKIISQPILQMLLGHGYGVLSESGKIRLESLLTTNAHNGFLQIFAGTGLIGFSMFLFYLFQLTLILKTSFKKVLDEKSKNTFWTILSLFFFIVINNFAESSFGSHIVPQLVIFLFLSLMVTNTSDNPINYPSHKTSYWGTK